MAKIHQHPAHSARIVGSVCILITCSSHGCHHWILFDIKKVLYLSDQLSTFSPTSYIKDRYYMLKINKVQMVAKDHQIYSFLISKCITSMGLLQVSDEQEMWILQCMLILQIALSFCQENSAHLFASGEGLL